MSQLEQNIRNSFKLVKEDISTLQREVLEISIRQQRILEMLSHLNTKKTAKAKVKTTKRTFVASKFGDKFHDKHCPFAKNIKPKSKLVFKTKDTALNKGYKPCDCVN